MSNQTPTPRVCIECDDQPAILHSMCWDCFMKPNPEADKMADEVFAAVAGDVKPTPIELAEIQQLRKLLAERDGELAVWKRRARDGAPRRKLEYWAREDSQLRAEESTDN